MAAKKLKSAVKASTQPWLDKHGDSLVEKVVAAEGNGAAGAAANLFRTLVEFCIPKPDQKVDVTGFGGGEIHVKIEGVD